MPGATAMSEIDDVLRAQMVHALEVYRSTAPQGEPDFTGGLGAQMGSDTLIYDGKSWQRDRVSEYALSRLGDVDLTHYVEVHLPPETDMTIFQVGDRAVTRFGEGTIEAFSATESVLFIKRTLP